MEIPDEPLPGTLPTAAETQPAELPLTERSTEERHAQEEDTSPPEGNGENGNGGDANGVPETLPASQESAMETVPPLEL